MPLDIARNDITNMQELLNSVKSYIDERYIEEETLRESCELRKLAKSITIDKETYMESCELPPDELITFNRLEIDKAARACASMEQDDSLEFLLLNLDAGFSETLLTLIDLSGKKDSEVYKKANVDRKLFSKIRNNPEYKPSKPTALAFAFALELDLYETKEFIGRAGYALSRSSKFDIIVEYFLLHRNYNIFELNNVLYEFDQPLIGA